VDLIEKSDIINAANLDKLNLEFAADLLMKLFNIDRLNEYYTYLIGSGVQGFEFIEKAIKDINVSLQVSDEDLKNIPANGAFIVISNHPFGMLDGLIMLNIIGKVRPDVKVIANFMLQKFEPIKHLFIPVNPFENKDLGSSLMGIKQTLLHLQGGHPVGIFPAGEVSTYQSALGGVFDKEWHQSAIKIIKKANVTVVPIYFGGSNSFLFHLLGMIHPALRTIRIPTELFNKENSVIRVRIGASISPDELNSFDKTAKLGRYLRTKVYALGTALNVKKFYKPTLRSLLRPQSIIPPIEVEVLKKELDGLSKSCLIHTQKNYDLYIASAEEIPNILNEIGRLREITFRDIGEGSNRKIDVDEFDLYYHHLFLWDREASKIVGAYRMGRGKEIFAQYGKKGFYVNSLFKFSEEFEPILKETIELGRSFISKEYQNKPFPLFILWKGILYFLFTNPEYRYLIGPVSISNRYSPISKSLLIEFIKAHYYDERMASMVRARKDFEVDLESLDKDILFEKYKGDLNELDKLIADIEPEKYRIPVLLKKYIKQNAKIIGFNIDPKFNDALDGLMILNLNDLPEDTINNLKKEMNITV
jgi:putative hemolysin